MRSRPSFRSIGFGFAIAGAAWAAFAAAPASKVLRLGDATIAIAWDQTWVEGAPGADVPQNAGGFHAPDPLHMSVMLTAHAPPGTEGIDEAMRTMVEANAKETLSSAVETDLPVEAFKNGDTHGYQFCATDKAPKPDEWKYICQGMASVGSWVVGYTVLYNDPGKATAMKAVKALQAMQASTGA
ncbi:MAG TPA: hypothetical protein VFL16_05785 [Steroidobacteraceae bacterium]|nr:hypothetical protein [Steroidobacteraceae bacterium]